MSSWSRAAASVDRLAQDVGVPGVLRHLRDAPDEQRARASCAAAPRATTRRSPAASSGSSRTTASQCAARPAVERDEVGSRDSSAVAHMSADVPDRAVLDPRQPLARRPPDGVAEVGVLDPGHVLDEAEQVGAAGRQRAAHVVVVQPVERSQQGVAALLEVARRRAVIPTSSSPSTATTSSPRRCATVTARLGWWLDTSALTPEETAERVVVHAYARGGVPAGRPSRALTEPDGP